MAAAALTAPTPTAADLEAALDPLAEAVRAARAADPLAPVTLLVPDAAVGRWLVAGLAHRLGVAAGLQPLTVRAWLRGLCPSGPDQDGVLDADRLAAALRLALADLSLPPPVAVLNPAEHDAAEPARAAPDAAQTAETPEADLAPLARWLRARAAATPSVQTEDGAATAPDPEALAALAAHLAARFLDYAEAETNPLDPWPAPASGATAEVPPDAHAEPQPARAWQRALWRRVLDADGRLRLGPPPGATAEPQLPLFQPKPRWRLLTALLADPRLGPRLSLPPEVHAVALGPLPAGLARVLHALAERTRWRAWPTSNTATSPAPRLLPAADAAAERAAGVAAVCAAVAASAEHPAGPIRWDAVSVWLADGRRAAELTALAAAFAARGVPVVWPTRRGPAGSPTVALARRLLDLVVQAAADPTATAAERAAVLLDPAAAVPAEVAAAVPADPGLGAATASAPLTPAERAAWRRSLDAVWPADEGARPGDLWPGALARRLAAGHSPGPEAEAAARLLAADAALAADLAQLAAPRPLAEYCRALDAFWIRWLRADTERAARHVDRCREALRAVAGAQGADPGAPPGAWTADPTPLTPAALATQVAPRLDRLAHDGAPEATAPFPANAETAAASAETAPPDVETDAADAQTGGALGPPRGVQLRLLGAGAAAPTDLAWVLGLGPDAFLARAAPDGLDLRPEADRIAASEPGPATLAAALRAAVGAARRGCWFSWVAEGEHGRPVPLAAAAHDLLPGSEPGQQAPAQPGPAQPGPAQPGPAQPGPAQPGAPEAAAPALDSPKPHRPEPAPSLRRGWALRAHLTATTGTDSPLDAPTWRALDPDLRPALVTFLRDPVGGAAADTQAIAQATPALIAPPNPEPEIPVRALRAYLESSVQGAARWRLGRPEVTDAAQALDDALDQPPSGLSRQPNGARLAALRAAFWRGLTAEQWPEPDTRPARPSPWLRHRDAADRRLLAAWHGALLALRAPPPERWQRPRLGAVDTPEHPTAASSETQAALALPPAWLEVAGPTGPRSVRLTGVLAPLSPNALATVHCVAEPEVAARHLLPALLTLAALAACGRAPERFTAIVLPGPAGPEAPLPTALVRALPVPSPEGARGWLADLVADLAQEPGQRRLSIEVVERWHHERHVEGRSYARPFERRIDRNADRRGPLRDALRIPLAETRQMEALFARRFWPLFAEAAPGNR